MLIGVEWTLTGLRVLTDAVWQCAGTGTEAHLYFDWKREFPMHEIGPVSVGFTDLTSLVERADVPTQYNCTA